MMPENIYNLGIFKGIERLTIERIVESCPTKNFKEGETILVEGEDSNGEGYILKTGRVGIRISGKKIAELGIGNIFGEIALLNEEQRTATVRALEDIEVIILSLDNLIEMINNDNNNINKTIMNRIEENLER